MAALYFDDMYSEFYGNQSMSDSRVAHRLDVVQLVFHIVEKVVMNLPINTASAGKGQYYHRVLSGRTALEGE